MAGGGTGAGEFSFSLLPGGKREKRTEKVSIVPVSYKRMELTGAIRTGAGWEVEGHSDDESEVKIGWEAWKS